MPKKAWFFKNKTLLGILSVMLVFGTLAIGCPTTDPESSSTTYTVTFNTDGGSAVPDQKVEEGKKVSKPANPTKAGYTFVAWYRNSAKTTQWNFDTDTVTANITLYAKWTSTSELAQYAGVWRSSSTTYLLQADGRAWRFSSDGYFYRDTWSTSKISSYAITFNEAKTQFTLTTSNSTLTYTKNTSETKTPVAAT